MTLTTAPQLDSENPWPGLASFEENAHAFFFGRTDETSSLLGHVLDTPVTVLYGSSGLGKTSLLRAGLFPVLRERNFLPVYVRLELKPGAPGLSQQLHESVSRAIRAEAPDAELPADDESLWEYLHRKGLELWSTGNQLLTPVIVIDQFEEVFTLGDRVPALVDAFRDELGDLAENRIPAGLAARIDEDETVADQFDLRSRRFKLLISLREDFLPALEEWCGLIPALGRSRVRLHRLHASHALEAVHEPAAHLITDDLACRVVSIVAGKDLQPAGTPQSTEPEPPNGELEPADVEPALLSLFCRELNEMRKRRSLPHFDEQLVEDAKEHTLANYYSSCVGHLPKRVARFIESELITETGFRDRYIREDAVPTYLADDELEQLIQSRLLRIEEDRNGAQWIELTHDVLTDVVREHRDARRATEDKAALAARTAELEADRERQQAELDKAKKRSRVLRAVLAATALIAVVAIVAAVVAVVAFRQANDAQQQADAQRQEADKRTNEAFAQRLTSEGQAILTGGQPGSELAAFVKLITAQHISPDANPGGLLVALDRKSRIQAIDPSAGFVSGDGRRIVTTGPAGAQTVDTQTWKPVGHPFGELEWLRMGLSFSGRYLGSFDYSDKVIRVWDFDAGNYIGQPMSGSDSYVADVAVSADGRLVAASDAQRTARLWDVESGRLIATLTQARALEFSLDGRRLATAGDELSVQLWDTETGAALLRTQPAGDERLGDDDTIENLAFSPDGSIVAAGGRTVGLGSVSGGSPVRLWDTGTGELIATPVVGDYGRIRALAFSPDGQRIATGSDDNSVRLWDARTGQPVGEPLGFKSNVWQIAFTREGNKIIAVSEDGAQTVDADPDAHMPVESAGSKAAALRPDELIGVDINTDVPYIVLARDNALHRVNADTGEDRAYSNSLPVSMNDEEASHDGRWLAIAGTDHVIRVLDTSNGQFVGSPLQGHEDTVNDLEFSPDGQTLASASADNTVRLWDWRAGRQIGEPLTGHEDAVGQLVFSDDGEHLFTRGGGSIQIWDLTIEHPTGKALGGDRNRDFFTAMAVNGDDNLIAAATGDGTIQQWDVGTDETHGREMKGHNQGVSDIAYSPDGRYLSSIGSGGTDDTLRFWDTESGNQIGEPVDTTPLGATSRVKFSGDGRWVYVVGHGVSLNGEGPQEGRDAIWRLPAPLQWEHELCAKLTVNPSEAQWKEWVSAVVPYQEPCPGKPRTQ
ncbi:nSTAND1 domain-containing NTPase [Rhodococcus maanshanensis]|uniref:WD40 repeat n=1 Tax=Rhodococcus maanshanensis TaxID=183556 RepID=A0A1H7U203_9NOCA|nr:hypothetical protein [Rhodococcus maanshanensis]SEL91110.1 WD40 repeat [Rhodococcus maanshanensis]